MTPILSRTAAFATSLLLTLTCRVAFSDTPVPGSDKKAPLTEGADWTEAQLGRDHTLLVTGRRATPEGEWLKLPGRVLCLELVRGGKFLAVKTSTHLASVDTDAWTVADKLTWPDRMGAGMHGLAPTPSGESVLATGGVGDLLVVDIAADGKLKIAKKIDLRDKGKKVAPLGVAVSPDGHRALVALSVSNEVARVDLVTGRVLSRTQVGVCPYGLALSRDGKTAFVSNFGGDRARPGENTETSAGTPVAVDARSIPLRGTISILDLAGRDPVVRKTLTVGLHPGELRISPDGATLAAANLGDDSVSLIDVASGKVRRTLDIKPEPGLPYGTLCDGLEFSPDGQTLLVAAAGINALAQIDLAHPEKPPGLTATGRHPGGVRLRDSAAYVSCVFGGIQKIRPPRDEVEKTARDTRARESARIAHALRAAEHSGSAKTAPQPVPARVGDPSPIRHVVYIIKENRTYDQILGDIGRGNSEPKFCNFPRKITPNHHALADQFVLLDNYYCNGVLSSDGHAWSVQGMTTSYREKDFSGYHCAYDFGTDSLCYASCGFIWDLALLHGKSFRNYGELDLSVKVRGKTYDDFYNDWKNKTGKTAFRCVYKLEALRRYSCPDFPGWEMSIPDQVRADAFLKELADFERRGEFPDLTLIYLPNDHTAGELTANSYLADNDLALGRIIEGLSHSKFWKNTAVFVNEDDPQAGQDHVDGHRSLCFVISPWAKRGAIVSRFYNQSSVLHTMSRILGLPPLNQMVAGSPTMEHCFTDKPDFSPCVALPAGSPLNEPRPKKAANTAAWVPGLFLSPEERLARRFDRLDFSAPDLIEEDTLNRSIWAETRPGIDYPAAYAGAHGKGLAALGLAFDPNAEDDDD